MSNELDNKQLVALYQDITIDQMDKFLEKVDDNSNAILNVSIDVHKTLNLYIENHYECIRRTNKKLNKENKDGR